MSDVQRNCSTIQVPLTFPLSGGMTTRKAFCQAWPLVRKQLGDRDTYVVAAVSESSDQIQLLSVDRLSATPRDIIIGRHASCDLPLTEDLRVALRQVLARFYINDNGTVCVRLIDLRTQEGFWDEYGRVSRGVISNGHLFIRIPGYHLLAIHSGQRLPKRPLEAWRSLPKRLYSDSTPMKSLQLALRPRLLLVPPKGEITHITHIGGPTSLPELSQNNQDKIVGALIFDKHCVQLTQTELSGGVLIGRYDRCHLTEDAISMSECVSRVHLCLLLDDRGVWAIDIASTNGSYCNGEQFRTTKLGNHTPLELPGNLNVKWQVA